MRSRRFWRPLIGVVAAYAVAGQTLLIALAGLTLAANAADAGLPGFELCHHGAQDAPDLPARAPNDSGCSHCIFCFAGSHHALVTPPAALFHSVDVEIINVRCAPESQSAPRLSAYSIASPRGPPFAA